jgi:glutamate 5-kinase
MQNINSFKRIVIKVGSSLLADSKGRVNQSFLSAVSADIEWLLENGKEVLVVSSGAIAMGRKKIILPKKLSLSESQALAAHGQIELMSAWKKSLSKYSISIGQMLLTPKETELKVSSINAKQTVNKLIEIGCLPVINENDSTATDEIKFGDNDLLAAKVAKLMEADLLIILSSVDGLFTSEDMINKKKPIGLVQKVTKINSKIKRMAGTASEMGKGGMISKIEAAEICFQNNCSMVITSGNKIRPIRALNRGAKSTWFVK